MEYYIQMEKLAKKNEGEAVMLIDEETIRNKIYIIRGQKVMLDADLAYSEIYKKAEKINVLFW